jgi:hypothetical protein
VPRLPLHQLQQHQAQLAALEHAAPHPAAPLAKTPVLGPPVPTLAMPKTVSVSHRLSLLARVATLFSVCHEAERYILN